MSYPRSPDACPGAPPDHRLVTAVSTPQRGRQRAGVWGCASALGPRGPAILSKGSWGLSCISSPASDPQPGWELLGSQATLGGGPGAPGSALRGPQTLRGQGRRDGPHCRPWRSPPPSLPPDGAPGLPARPRGSDLQLDSGAGFPRPQSGAERGGAWMEPLSLAPSPALGGWNSARRSICSPLEAPVGAGGAGPSPGQCGLPAAQGTTPPGCGALGASAPHGWTLLTPSSFERWGAEVPNNHHENSCLPSVHTCGAPGQPCRVPPAGLLCGQSWGCRGAGPGHAQGVSALLGSGGLDPRPTPG